VLAGFLSIERLALWLFSFASVWVSRGELDRSVSYSRAEIKG